MVWDSFMNEHVRKWYGLERHWTVCSCVQWLTLRPTVQIILLLNSYFQLDASFPVVLLICSYLRCGNYTRLRKITLNKSVRHSWAHLYIAGYVIPEALLLIKQQNYIFLIIAVKCNYCTASQSLLLLLKLKTGPVENNYHNNDLGHTFWSCYTFNKVCMERSFPC